MIELLLAAENALALGLLDQAERTYRQVLAADPRNGIAAVGLARVALERGDEPGALALARDALAIDPDNATARRLIDRLEEVASHRAATAAGGAPPASGAAPPSAPAAAPSPASGAAPPPAPAAAPPPAPAAAPPPTAAATPTTAASPTVPPARPAQPQRTTPSRRGLLRRILRRS